MSGIQLSGVVKRFGATTVLRGVDLVVPDGSFTAVLGASGSGKTTLLRAVAGFERIDAGAVSIGGRVVDDGRQSVPAQRRGVGYVPQDGALFPHLTVAGNVGFGVPRRERRRVAELLELVGLTEFAKHFPHQLSGGQQQRVALARALAIRPATVLLDEPFSSLDASLRDGVRREVSRILRRSGTTAVLVTHDQDEALALADQVAILREGRVAVCAAPRDLYGAPPDLDAATSVGEVNVLAAQVDRGWASCALGRVPLRRPAPAGPSLLLVRPEQVVLHPQAQQDAAAGVVTDVQYHGHDALVRVALGTGNEVILARVPGDLAVAAGEQVWLTVSGAGLALPGAPDRSIPAPLSPTATAGA